MTTSLIDATLKAVSDALKAGVTLGQVFSAPPENTKPPIALIGDITLEEAGGKDGGLYSASFQVLSIVAGSSRRAAYGLMLEVEGCLDDQELAATGASFSRMRMASVDDRVDAESGLIVGTQAFEVFVQPA